MARRNAFRCSNSGAARRLIRGRLSLEARGLFTRHSRQFDEQAERLAIIAPILKTEKRTAERAEAFRLAAAKMHVLRGKPATVAEKTLREWVLRHETNGSAALLPPQRADKGKARVLVTREWDAGIDLCEADKERIAAEVVKNAKSMIANDGASIREVIRLSEHKLFRLSDVAGSTLAPQKLTALCKLNTKWAPRNDLNSFRMIYLKNKDHKAWQDKAVVRIRRDLHPMPMGLLIGDVHYVDILIAEGKAPIRARLIAWMDASSLFAFVTPVFLSKAQGIRQEDVAKSLAQVTQCRHGGIAGEYYLDNGSEYSALASAMAHLSVLADMQFKVTLAKPYSPTSKGEIEGFFNVLEGILKGLPGWIGGDRTNKKSANKGQVYCPLFVRPSAVGSGYSCGGGYL